MSKRHFLSPEAIEIKLEYFVASDIDQPAFYLTQGKIEP